jgi:hypothetical protein
MTQENEERRSYIRGDFSYKVKFRVMAANECRLEKIAGHPILLRDEKILKADAVPADSKEKDMPLNAALIDFLIQMDEKLDQILSALSDSDSRDRLFRECLGVDISASGMGIITDRPVESGQVIHANIILSRLPFVSMDVVGEIIQVTPVEGEDESTVHAGIRFLDLDPQDKEKIIKCVFQKERASIREKKLREDDENESAAEE